MSSFLRLALAMACRMALTCQPLLGMAQWYATPNFPHAPMPTWNERLLTDLSRRSEGVPTREVRSRLYGGLLTNTYKFRSRHHVHVTICYCLRCSGPTLPRRPEHLRQDLLGIKRQGWGIPPELVLLGISSAFCLKKAAPISIIALWWVTQAVRILL